MLSTVGIFIYTKYWELLYVEHCGKMYLHKIPRNTVCWALWEDLLTKNTGLNIKYYQIFCVNNLPTVLSKQYSSVFCVNKSSHSAQHNVFPSKIYLHKILYVEHCGKIYLHKILGITSCWTLWEYLFTQNTGDYFMWEDLFTQHTEE
jgi:hypothetical protein